MASDAKIDKLNHSLEDIIAADKANGKAQKPRQRRTPYSGRGQQGQGVSNRVFVGNLHFSVTWQQLKDKFREAGDVSRARILQSPDGKSKGCGIVEFETVEGAQKAIAELQNADLNGRAIFVREDVQPHQPQQRPPRAAAAAPAYAAPAYGAPYGYEDKEALNRRKLTHDIGASIRFNHPPEHQIYIGNLPWTCTWQDLKNLASKYGTVVRADILEDPNTGRSRGAGTVVFANTEDAAKCIEELNHSQFENRELTVRFDVAAQKRAEKFEPDVDFGDFGASGWGNDDYGADDFDDTGAKLYVGNLPWSASWQDLKDFFARVGEVVRADVALDRVTGRSKGFGTVTFAKKADAERAIQELNDTEFRGRNIQVRLDNYNNKHQQ